MDDGGRQDDGDARGRQVALQAVPAHLGHHARDVLGRLAHPLPRRLLHLDRRARRLPRRRRQEQRPVQRRDGRVVHHVQQVALHRDRLGRLRDGLRAQRAVAAALGRVLEPFSQVPVHLLDLLHVVRVLVGQQHVRAVGRVLGPHAGAAEDAVLHLEDVADEPAQLRLLDAHDGQLALHLDVADEGALGPQHLVVLGQRLDLEVVLDQRGDVEVSGLDPRGPPHPQRDQAVSHEAGPPHALPQLLLPRRHGRLGRVPVEADRVRQRYRDAHPVPRVFGVVGRLVPVRHEQQALDQDQAVRLVIKVVEELLQERESEGRRPTRSAATYTITCIQARCLGSGKAQLTLVREKKALRASLRL